MPHRIALLIALLGGCGGAPTAEPSPEVAPTGQWRMEPGDRIELAGESCLLFRHQDCPAGARCGAPVGEPVPCPEGMSAPDDSLYAGTDGRCRLALANAEPRVVPCP